MRWWPNSSGGAGEPQSISGVLALGDGRGLELHALPAARCQTPASARTPCCFALLGALAGGILLNLMPCVFPVLALKTLHLARSGGDERTARRDALGYAAGAVAGTGALGIALLAIRAGGSAAGWAFQLQDPRTILLLVLLTTAITLNLLRVFELPVIGGERNPAGSFGTGALAAFVATPCAGPFLGAALGTALLLPAAGSIAVFAALGLGLALPFVVVAFVPALAAAPAQARAVDGPPPALPRRPDGADRASPACGCCGGRAARSALLAGSLSMAPVGRGADPGRAQRSGSHGRPSRYR